MSEGSAETWLDGMHRELRELRLRIIALERKRKREIGVAAFRGGDVSARGDRQRGAASSRTKGVTAMRVASHFKQNKACASARCIDGAKGHACDR
jgi:hypothetical protein